MNKYEWKDDFIHQPRLLQPLDKWNSDSDRRDFALFLNFTSLIFFFLHLVSLGVWVFEGLSVNQVPAHVMAPGMLGEASGVTQFPPAVHRWGN